MRVCKRWTEEEMELLRANYSKPGGLEFLIAALHRPRQSIWHCARRAGLAHYMYVLRGAKGAKGNKGEGAQLTIETLKENTTENAATGCWNWNGGKHPFGYGKIMIRRKTLNTHRVMFEVAYPNISLVGLNVNHHCDNPACINPAHLYAGTQRENVQDQVKRGRHRWDRTNA